VVTIASGQTSTDIVISALTDSVIEGPETLTLILGDTGSYDVGTPGSATITIADATSAAPVPAVPLLAVALNALALAFVGSRRRSK
jgi:hypothetical protein